MIFYIKRGKNSLGFLYTQIKTNNKKLYRNSLYVLYLPTYLLTTTHPRQAGREVWLIGTLRRRYVYNNKGKRKKNRKKNQVGIKIYNAVSSPSSSSSALCSLHFVKSRRKTWRIYFVFVQKYIFVCAIIRGYRIHHMHSIYLWSFYRFFSFYNFVRYLQSELCIFLLNNLRDII